MTTWHRGVDPDGRLFALAITGDQVAIYFPDLPQDEFVVAGKWGGSRGTSGIPVRYWRYDKNLVQLEHFKREFKLVELAEATMAPGIFYPRFYRGPEHPPIDVAARTATMRGARSLFSRLRNIFQVIEPTKGHDSVFGHELRQLLILASTEVESSWRAVLSANGYTRASGRLNTNDYMKLLGPMKLDSYSLTLASHPGYRAITPFHGWSVSDPAVSLAWYDSYNATKHNREEELHRATLRSVIEAMAAVHVMTVAQFGFEEVERGHFHADEFNFFVSPTWLADSYIRPLPPPDGRGTSFTALLRGAQSIQDWIDQWPHEWTKGPCPF